ncbi:hypothetical protein MKX01_042003 [Papaver californicum]|nr:hypothetical protein MKX01_042003 [Papaver californicum]
MKGSHFANFLTKRCFFLISCNLQEDGFIGIIISERSDDKDVFKDLSTNATNGNASMVNSPLTGCKYVVQKCDNAGSSSSKEHGTLIS